jgi:cation:H+ antiporter
LALLLAGAEPEELATSVTAALRGVPAIAYGDVIGTNVAMCTVALGLGALIAPLPFGPRVRRYALLALPVGLVAVVLIWDGHLGRPEGALLVGLYAAYVALIWVAERHPPALGELSEFDDHDHEPQPTAPTGVAVPTRARSRVGRDLLLVLAGLAAMAGGATVLVEAVRRISGIEETQTKLGLTVVGFATAFELVVLAVAAARRGMTETVLASVVGSFAYNVTMTLGAGALARPLTVLGADQLHLPLLAMLGALLFVLALALPTGRLTRPAGALLLAAYPAFIALVLAS